MKLTDEQKRVIYEKTKNLLLKHFKSVKRISLASETKISEIVGKSKASIIYAHFHPKIEPWESNIFLKLYNI